MYIPVDMKVDRRCLYAGTTCIIRNALKRNSSNLWKAPNIKTRCVMLDAILSQLAHAQLVAHTL